MRRSLGIHVRKRREVRPERRDRVSGRRHSRKCKERKAEDAKQRKERKAEDCKGKKVEEWKGMERKGRKGKEKNAMERNAMDGMERREMQMHSMHAPQDPHYSPARTRLMRPTRADGGRERGDCVLDPPLLPALVRLGSSSVRSHRRKPLEVPYKTPRGP